jgi:hypothetical protein
VGACGLREAAVRLLFDGMDQVGKLDRVLDEEDRDVVADEIPIALLGTGTPCWVVRTGTSPAAV